MTAITLKSGETLPYGSAPPSDAAGADGTIYGTADNDYLSVVYPQDLYQRTALYGFAGNDALSGGSQNDVIDGGDGNDFLTGEIGRASCRERVEISGGAGLFKKKKNKISEEYIT